jgi:hypothetical protein
LPNLLQGAERAAVRKESHGKELQEECEITVNGKQQGCRMEATGMEAVALGELLEPAGRSVSVVPAHFVE